MLDTFYFVFHSIRNALSWLEDVQVTELPHPVKPMKPPGNDGAGHDNSDAGRAVTQSDEEEESLPRRRGRAYFLRMKK